MDWLIGVAERRLSGDIDVDERTEVAAEWPEKTLDGGFEIGVSRSDENSKPGKFPRCSEIGGREGAVELGYMLLMYDEIERLMILRKV
jgi:hypothetical protein